uniref:Uncharacterized protein n=1 Tax=Tetraselmis sp. GSL018 TaxID=582737 RepID=A0A061RJ70_9CHLO
MAAAPNLAVIHDSPPFSHIPLPSP